MQIYGNKTWNNATDNREKSLVSMDEQAFLQLRERLENAGINYFAYSRDGRATMAVNDKDLDWLKTIVGEKADSLNVEKSDVEYTTPKKNIIGNAEYRYIPQKEYISLDSDTALKMAELLEREKIHFSGRVYPDGKATITVCREDLGRVKAVQRNVVQMRKQFCHEEKADEIIGNKSYREIHDRKFLFSKMKPDRYREIAPFLETEAQYSGLIRGGKVMFTVEKSESENFQKALEIAEREVDILHDLFDKRLERNQLYALADVAHQFAVEDIKICLDNFFDKRYSDEQFSEMLNLTQKYLAQSPIERISDGTVLEDMIAAKNRFDTAVELDDFFSEHDFDDKQKAAVAELFTKDKSRALIEEIDETFTAEDIHAYDEILHNYDKVSDITDFLDEHRQAVFERENAENFKDRFASEISETANQLSANERILETAKQGDYNEYLYAFREELLEILLMNENTEFKDKFFTQYSEMDENLVNETFGELKESLFRQAKKTAELTDKEKAFLSGDIVGFMAKSVLAWDEIESIGYRLFENGYNDRVPPSANASFGNGLEETDLHELAHRFQNGEDIRKELARSLIGNQGRFITTHDNEFTVKYGEDFAVAKYENAERQVSYEDLGNAFISLAENEYNDIVLDRTMEDLQNNLPDISDDTAKQLISAFSEHTMDGWQGDSVKENRIKRALYDILGDDDKTEKAFTSIAYMKYNHKAEKSPDKVNDAPKQEDIEVSDTQDTPTKIEVGDRFRNKFTGDICEVISLTGALPYITDDCTITRQSGVFEITENISYDKLFNNDLYKYLGKEDIQHEQAETVPEIVEDSLTFSFGSDNKFFTESELMADFAEKNPDISFALANAVFEYLDEKQHSEREISELNAGWYKKTDFAISAVINGEDFNYEGRFDIGDGKGTGGGSLIDHIRDFCEGVVKSNQYPFNTTESKENAQRNLDIFIPFLEEHSVLTAEEQKILSDFKAENPIRTENDIEKDKSKPTVSVAENKGPVTMRKVGDFYEMYGKNAQIAADVLDLHLTTKNGSEMVGFPDFKKQEYSDKLKENGYSVLVEEVYEIKPPQSDLDKAKQLISEYCADEFESNADFSDLSKVDLAFTADEETEIPIQAYADLENFRMVKEYGGTVVNEEQFDSLEDMCEKALQNLDFADLTSLSDEEKVKVQTVEEDIDAPLFTDADVIDEIQKNEHSAEEKPFWEQSDIQGEQLSLFGDSEPIKFEKFNPQKKAEPVKHGNSKLFVGNVNTMTALHDEIMRGSGFQDGKFRIQKFYEDNKPDTKAFAKMLRDEYGTGGHSADKPIAFVNHDSKGMEFQIRNDDGSLSDKKFDFSWTEVAKFTAELIGKDEYITHEDIDNRLSHAKYVYENYSPENPTESHEFEKAKGILQEYGVLDEKTVEQTVAEENISDEVAEIADEKTEEIAETAEPEKSGNFTITDDALGEGGAKAKFKANIAAIETLKTLEKENRPATDEEKETLSKYVGWGALAKAFDKSDDKWSAEYAELSELLTPQEYTQARASVNDAFYTPPVVVDSIYEALDKFGFEGGNVLEPAMGVGNFFGRMPEDMQKNSKLFGVEIDSISGRIAQKLYPDADIAIKGFEKNDFQNGCFDVAVGNVPFGDLGFKDEKHGTSKLHDYFFAETLDKIKDGGIVAFVTSAGTLDKKSEKTRQMLAEKSDFIGAIRLPGGKNGAFKDNAGTAVTTDIIFLQKNENKSLDIEKEPWISIGETADGLPINKYFADNPDMVLGTVVEGNKLYGSGTMVVADENADLKEQLHKAVGKLSAQIGTEKAKDVYAKNEQGENVKIPSNLRNYSFFLNNDKVFFKKNNAACEFRFDKGTAQHGRFKAFVEMRDITRELLEAQELNKSDDVVKGLQERLNTVYDDFYKKYGLIHSQTNKRYFSEDVSYNLVAGLEKKIDKNKLVEKSDIFTKRTICPPKAVEQVETAMEALTLSIAEKARVDFAYMGKLTGMTEDELKHDLTGEIFKVPHTENDYQTASEYLSGDIRAKLKIAEEVAEYDADFNINVSSLKAVMPEPLKAGDIDVKIGATWIDPKYYDQFMYELLQTPNYQRSDKPQSRWHKSALITAEYSEHSGSWHISNKSTDRSVLATQKYGSHRMNAYEIMEHILNLKEPKVYKTIEVPDGMGDVKEKRVVDIDATRVVQRKAEDIRKAFKGWIFKDSNRRDEIVGKYNELFNSIRPREYDGSALSFPMMTSDIHLHDHQKNAIAHAMFGGNTLFAHSVGAGKSATRS